MKDIDEKLHQIKQDSSELALKCSEIGDEKTHQLLLEVVELLEVTHDTFLGKALSNVPATLLKGDRKH